MLSPSVRPEGSVVMSPSFARKVVTGHIDKHIVHIEGVPGQIQAAVPQQLGAVDHRVHQYYISNLFLIVSQYKISVTCLCSIYKKYGLNYIFSVFEYKITSIRKNNNRNRNLYNNFLKEKV